MTGKIETFLPSLLFGNIDSDSPLNANGIEVTWNQKSHPISVRYIIYPINFWELSVTFNKLMHLPR